MLEAIVEGRSLRTTLQSVVLVGFAAILLTSCGGSDADSSTTVLADGVTAAPTTTTSANDGATNIDDETTTSTGDEQTTTTIDDETTTSSTTDESTTSSTTTDETTTTSTTTDTETTTTAPNEEPSTTQATTTTGLASTTIPAPSTQTVTWDWVIEDKRWGDPDVTVSASASSGAPVEYSTTSNACSVGSASGVVEIENVGTCTITATQDGNAAYQSADAELSFSIAKAQPVLTFADRTIRFERGGPTFSFWAESEPSIPLSYRKVDSTPYADPDFPEFIANAVVCDVVNEDTLLLHDLLPQPDGTMGHPYLLATCAIEVYVAEESPNYETPDPVVALVTIQEPVRSLSVLSSEPDPEPGETVTITVQSPEANSYGVDTWTDDREMCDLGLGATPEYPSPLGETVFSVVVSISNAASEGDSCTVYGQANPLDHGGSDIDVSVNLTIPSTTTTLSP